MGGYVGQKRAQKIGYPLWMAPNLVPGQLSYFWLKLGFFNPLFWSFIDYLGQIFFAKIINLSLYFHSISI